MPLTLSFSDDLIRFSSLFQYPDSILSWLSLLSIFYDPDYLSLIIDPPQYCKSTWWYFYQTRKGQSHEVLCSNSMPVRRNVSRITIEVEELYPLFFVPSTSSIYWLPQLAMQRGLWWSNLRPLKKKLGHMETILMFTE